jgi:predicted transcriptional regulator YdeE
MGTRGSWDWSSIPPCTQFDVLNIDSGTWVVFESIGPFPKTLQNVWGRIYSEWFPSSGYEAVKVPYLFSK